MTWCKTLDEVRTAARADHDGPGTQNQADLWAAILQPHLDWLTVATLDARTPKT